MILHFFFPHLSIFLLLGDDLEEDAAGVADKIKNIDKEAKKGKSS